MIDNSNHIGSVGNCRIFPEFYFALGHMPGSCKPLKAPTPRLSGQVAKSVQAFAQFPVKQLTLLLVPTPDTVVLADVSPFMVKQVRTQENCVCQKMPEQKQRLPVQFASHWKQLSFRSHQARQKELIHVLGIVCLGVCLSLTSLG